MCGSQQTRLCSRPTTRRTRPASWWTVPGDYTVGSARALAFEPPQLGSGAARDLIAVEGNLLRRFSRDGATAPLFDAGAGLPDLTLVNAVAVADDGTVLFSGFARRKRVYELWALNPQTLEVRLRATGTPQLTDAVYVGAEDAAAAALPGDGGLLAATAKAIMYFRKPADGWMSNAPADNPAPLRDATSLGLKGNTQLLSVDLVRTTRVLMLATSDRALLVTAGGLPTPFVAALPKPSDLHQQDAALARQKCSRRLGRGHRRVGSLRSGAAL